MSLLEDIYMEEDNEANDLERIIEGDDPENNEVRSDESDDGGNKSDEAEEDKRRINPKEPKEKRISKNPRFVLNPARLTGPRGIQTIQEHFKDFKFKGKGHEQEDLDIVLKKLEHWAHRLFPKFQFDDCLEKIEALGHKRQVMTHVKKIRQDLLDLDIPVAQHDSSEDEAIGAADPPPLDEFDQLLEQQIAIARSTPASVRPGSKAEQTSYGDHGNGTPRRSMENNFAFTPTNSTPVSTINTSINKPNPNGGLTEEQKERILRNRQLAEQKRLERIKLQQQTNDNTLLQKVPDTSQLDEYEKSKNNNEKDILKDVKSNETCEETTCLRTDEDNDASNMDEGTSVNGELTEKNSDKKDDESDEEHNTKTVKNKELEIFGDEEIKVLNVDDLETENDSQTKHFKENLNSIDIGSTSEENEGNIGKEMTKDFGDGGMKVVDVDDLEKGKDFYRKDIEDNSNGIKIKSTSNENEENIEIEKFGNEEITMASNAMEIEKDMEDNSDGNNIEITSKERDLKKQKTKMDEEYADGEMSMSLVYDDENSMNAS